MTLESSGTNEVNAAFERCKSALRLKDEIDPFAVFADLDDSVPIASDEADE